VEAASRAVHLGDVVTVSLTHGVRVLKVIGFADRRGPQTTAQTLYQALHDKAP
jgi:ribosome-associated heat shock protein Hsp15